MTDETLLQLAAVFLAIGLAVYAVDAWRRRRSSEKQARVLDRALLRQPTQEGERAALEDQRTLRQRVIQWIEGIGHRFESGRLGNMLLAPEDRLLLDQINRNTSAGRATFLGMRLVLALLLPAILALWLQPSGGKGVFQLLGALAVGVLLPKFVVDGWAKSVRKKADDELPLLIDLLRLLQGVGFSMDQCLQMISERFHAVLPVLGRELRDANTAYMHGRPRAQSLRRMAETFSNDGLQSLVQIIVQVHEHGGVVQEPLRQFAERLREQRKMSMKEKTGKLSVKMTVVMMLTLLPALMLVLAGPAVVSLIGTMAKLKGH
ncbi:type II secretion system F family protein [Dyella sp. 20L07]|uniref:type II secretion system F family protein n=1 Tax=Dyella sp. 20L07 TaxID=3384240 RepID=UPI003D2A729F